MLQITGQVVNVFTLDAGKDKDGKDYAERYKVQLMGNVALPNGDAKFANLASPLGNATLPINCTL